MLYSSIALKKTDDEACISCAVTGIKRSPLNEFIRQLAESDYRKVSTDVQISEDVPTIPPITGRASFGEVTIEVLSYSPIAWAGGIDLPAGKYVVEWVRRLISYGASGNFWALGFIGGWGGGVRKFVGPQILYSDGALEWPHGPTPQGIYFTEQAGIDAITAMGGQRVEFIHRGGPISIALLDPVYTDNTNFAVFELFLTSIDL